MNYPTKRLERKGVSLNYIDEGDGPAEQMLMANDWKVSRQRARHHAETDHISRLLLDHLGRHHGVS